MRVSFVVHAKFVRMRRITPQQEPFTINLFQRDFMPNYNVWTEYGERGFMLDNDDKEDDNIPNFGDKYGAFYKDTIMGTTLKLLQWKALLMVDFDPF
jgi:hypothetical protein